MRSWRPHDRLPPVRVFTGRTAVHSREGSSGVWGLYIPQMMIIIDVILTTQMPFAHIHHHNHCYQCLITVTTIIIIAMIIINDRAPSLDNDTAIVHHH